MKSYGRREWITYGCWAFSTVAFSSIQQLPRCLGLEIIFDTTQSFIEFANTQCATLCPTLLNAPSHCLDE